MDDRSAYAYDMDRQAYGRVPGYWDFLKYHLLLFALPSVIAYLLLHGQFVYLVTLMVYGFQSMAGGAGEITPGEWGAALAGSFQLIAYGAIAGIGIRVLSAGLFFLPTLARSGRLNLGTVLKTGLRYFFPTLFVMILISLILGFASTFLSFIPLINFVAGFVVLYAQALVSIYYDYWFSYNEAAGRPVYSNPSDRWKALYGSGSGTFWLYALLLSLSYIVLASTFVKPYIQMKITQRMGMAKSPDGW
ncbi:hypothetical protein [Saccharibacillus alkalitolerans]|uniref:Uncharacterized protein n=1 Tax=Saccharibacillus alkalitolerans TaxID=2705290 RepID=A0ABX0F9C9_9BACL|nr:hypothetical protein [Saccharibacillus alkalitolerans]NGZ76624.1 hypothetical protein [Saccharibacillus alkalitolerans]